jgi:hypothetical protein
MRGLSKKKSNYRKNEKKKCTQIFKLLTPVPAFIDPVFAKTRPKRSFSVMENERFEIVFAKTGSINSGTGMFTHKIT